MPLSALFRWLRFGRTYMDEERRLYRVDRDAYRYAEGERSVIVQVEMLRGVPSDVIYAQSVRSWLTPHGDESIDDAKRREVVERIRDHLNAHGHRAEIDWDAGETGSK